MMNSTLQHGRSPMSSAEKRKGVILILFAILCSFVPWREAYTPTIESRAKSQRRKESRKNMTLRKRESRTKTARPLKDEINSPISYSIFCIVIVIVGSFPLVLLYDTQ
jgi:hypothetical protein